MCVSVFGVAEGVDGVCMPLPTRPQRYCDPASLVYKTSGVRHNVFHENLIEHELIMQ